MNERIKELAEQAGFRPAHPMSGLDPNSVFPPMNYNGECGDALQQLAELIVRECVESIPADGHRGDFGRAVEFCQQQIKQHFGVEE